jgi:glycosyltransferase involved in cell wall biosynthesis
MSYNSPLTEPPAVIWFEVEDFLRYFDHYTNPTGIGRVSFEIFAAAHELSTERQPVKFCRVSMFTGRFEQVSFEQIVAAYTGRRGADSPWSILPLPRQNSGKWLSILEALARYPRYAYRVIGHFLGDVRKRHTPGDENELAPGDVILCVGASWVDSKFARYIARLKGNHKIRFVQLIHDVIPILYPIWTPRFFERAFRRWLRSVVPVSDVIVTISQHSRADLESVAAPEGFALPPVRIIRWGSGFPSGARCALTEPSSEPNSDVQSLPERFVLYVSTFEKRKNHELLLTVWQNLIATHGAANIPHLVMVGRMGYLVYDSRSIHKKLLDRRFNQRVMAAGHTNDRGLLEAYQRCLFTVFPSLYEGWGLPVDESLAHGKLCLASNCSSIPEVGGDCVDYFDPNDAADVQRVLEHALFEPGYLEARERYIQAHYRPATWRDCALELIQHAERLAPAAAAR